MTADKDSSMRIHHHDMSTAMGGAAHILAPAEIVMGLRWSSEERAIARGETATLDARCLLADSEGRVVEAVHPRHPHNTNGSVLHTGDSCVGASEWDDERIFVFLDALPARVSAVTFVVASPSGRPLGEFARASCHVSDRITEQACILVDLPALGAAREHIVATLSRTRLGSWILAPHRTESERRGTND